MDMTNETLITLCWELHEQCIPMTHIAQRMGKHRETISIWIHVRKTHGLLEFLNSYAQAQKGERKRRQVDPLILNAGYGTSESENMIVADKKSSTFLSMIMAFPYLFPVFMKFSLRNMFFVLSEKRIKCVGFYR